jgi:hypothetical protein
MEEICVKNFDLNFPHKLNKNFFFVNIKVIFYLYCFIRFWLQQKVASTQTIKY